MATKASKRPNPGSCLLPEIIRWFDDRVNFDLYLYAGADPRPVKCHKVVLAAASPLLKSLLDVEGSGSGTVVFEDMSRWQLIKLVLFFYNKAPIFDTNIQFFEKILKTLKITNYHQESGVSTSRNEPDAQYKCRICNRKQFYLKDDLQRHLNNHKEDLIEHNIRLIDGSLKIGDTFKSKCPACFNQFGQLLGLQSHFRECTVGIITELEKVGDDGTLTIANINEEKICNDLVNVLMGNRGSSEPSRKLLRDHAKKQEPLSCNKCRASFPTKESRILHDCDSKFAKYVEHVEPGSVRQTRPQIKTFAESPIKLLASKGKEEQRINATSTSTGKDSGYGKPNDVFSSESSDDDVGTDVEDVEDTCQGSPSIDRKGSGHQEVGVNTNKPLGCHKCGVPFATKESSRLHNCDSKLDKLAEPGSLRHARPKSYAESPVQASRITKKHHHSGSENLESKGNAEAEPPKSPTVKSPEPVQKDAFSSESSDDDSSTDVEEPPAKHQRLEEEKIQNCIYGERDDDGDNGEKEAVVKEICQRCGKEFKDLVQHQRKEHQNTMF